jgi:bifunctional non-homologous end joining protein LigD
MNVHWRKSKPARGGLRTPEGFILPARPSLAVQAPTGPDWIHELKHDGWRLLAWKQGAQVRLWTRQARDVTRHFEQITVAMARLPVESVLLDGEAVVFRADGHSDFHALTSRGGGMEAVMVAFDILHHAGEDIRREPIESRRDQVARLVAGQNHLLFSQAIDGDGPEIFEHACRLGAEGIISKRRGSSYRSGRVDTWKKIKFSGFERR